MFRMLEKFKKKSFIIYKSVTSFLYTYVANIYCKYILIRYLELLSVISNSIKTDIALALAKHEQDFHEETVDMMRFKIGATVNKRLTKNIHKSILDYKIEKLEDEVFNQDTHETSTPTTTPIPTLSEEKPMKKHETTIIAIGDVHGELESLKKILVHAGLMDHGMHWTGGNHTLVQTGDMIDRGKHSRECYELLARLQCEAPRSGGKVVRLVGNHELELLQGMPLEEFEGWKSFRQTLRHDVLAKVVQGAYAGQGYLFIHAGVRTEMQRHLLAGVDVTTADQTKAEILAEKINNILVNATAQDEFGDPIFRAGMSRGGAFKVGGIFWEDAQFMHSSADAWKVRQVFGHTPRRRGLKVSATSNLINIDAGMHHFGNLAYIVIENGKSMPVKIEDSAQ